MHRHLPLSLGLGDTVSCVLGLAHRSPPEPIRPSGRVVSSRLTDECLPELLPPLAARSAHRSPPPHNLLIGRQSAPPRDRGRGLQQRRGGTGHGVGRPGTTARLEEPRTSEHDTKRCLHATIGAPDAWVRPPNLALQGLHRGVHRCISARAGAGSRSAAAAWRARHAWAGHVDALCSWPAATAGRRAGCASAPARAAGNATPALDTAIPCPLLVRNTCLLGFQPQLLQPIVVGATPALDPAKAATLGGGESGCTARALRLPHWFRITPATAPGAWRATSTTGRRAPAWFSADALTWSTLDTRASTGPSFAYRDRSLLWWMAVRGKPNSRS